MYESQNISKKGKLFIIAAPSGGGKTSVALGAVNYFKNIISIEKVITFTTRQPRKNEISGQDYHFVSIDEFRELKNRGEFLETTQYNENFYASPASIISGLKNGKSFIMITDVAGAKNFKHEIIPDAVTIWITIPSLAILQQRLEKRNTESKEVLAKRLKMAESEMAQENREHFFQYHVLNDKLEKAIQEVVLIIKKELQL
jgi:guanylate kinase